MIFVQGLFSENGRYPWIDLPQSIKIDGQSCNIQLYHITKGLYMLENQIMEHC